ncbi:MbtH family NRPS accessory protein [Streptomyces daliensis]|uniref:MbtH family NRPS accessory protein n=1 Tax=Streptomyces daliensis TaxID=299421 RepID=A0A8T4J1K3_9ACTN|nr:MbtH family NRPS accessory protein [Streptomyces daliensis]
MTAAYTAFAASSAPAPFEAPEGDPDRESHLVLRAPRGERALWPVFAPVPGGWGTEFGPAAHAACVTHIETSG